MNARTILNDFEKRIMLTLGGGFSVLKGESQLMAMIVAKIAAKHQGVAKLESRADPIPVLHGESHGPVESIDTDLGDYILAKRVEGVKPGELFKCIHKANWQPCASHRAIRIVITCNAVFICAI